MQVAIPDIHNHEQLLQLANSYTVSQCLFATAQLGLADYLFHAPKTCVELADLTCTHAHSLQRLLKVLVGLKLLKEEQEENQQPCFIFACRKKFSKSSNAFYSLFTYHAGMSMQFSAEDA